MTTAPSGVMQEIRTINDIQSLLKQGFEDWRSLGDVAVGQRDELRIFNYTTSAQFAARWNFFEQVSRGLILNAQTGEIVARPFDKFFNWGEGNRFSQAAVVNVLEKMDGSLGILYRHQGKHQIATRGSFDSEQAVWATEWLNRHVPVSDIPEQFTLLFEIVYPGNRVVVDYQGFEGLVLLDIRDRYTGQYCRPYSTIAEAAQTYGLPSPPVYDFMDIKQVMARLTQLNANQEGFVVEFADGQRFKFKGDAYRKLHKIISGLSFKNTLACVANGTLAELLAVVPDEFLGEVNGWVAQIQETVAATNQEIDGIFAQAPPGDRKAFAAWVMTHHKPQASYLFAKLDGKPLEPLIYKQAF